MATPLFKSYALIGSGRVASHFQYYLKLLNLPVQTWARNSSANFNSLPDQSLQQVVAKHSHILFAIRDDALADVTRPFLQTGKVLVHFSGALSLPGVCAAHPVMTFGPRIEEANWYPKIPFVLDDGHALADILPGLANPSFHMSAKQRALYHALISLAANSSFLLWHNIGDVMESRLNLPRQLLSPLLHQVVENAGLPSSGGLTGPVARQDWQTVLGHLDGLQHVQPALFIAYRQYLHLAESSGYPIPKDIL